ncbi:MAG: hypothetical protein JW881_13180 [Spirochaetales bacterium]|nr:hypothetical protein [Spirochaetales bacterium]
MYKKQVFTVVSVLIVFLCCVIDTAAQTATINANTVQQYIRGFGAANIIGWRDDMTAADRILAFSVTEGIGLSVLRVRVSPNSADWASNKASIDAAKSNGAMVIASAWSAPASMKTNNNTTGGNLKTDSYAAYATHLRDFCSAVGGVDAISPINEPNITVDYESMEMSASDVASFVAAQGANCGAPIFAPEPYNMSQSFINQYLSNSGARSNTKYVAGHIYGTSPSAFDPGMEVWMTEHYVDSNTNGNDWNKSMNVAKELHDCMNAGYSMYVWWYIKRYYGPIEEDGTITKTGYVMAHYARYVRPGSNKISCTASPASNVYTTAYKNGSNLVVVAVNRNSSTSTVTFNVSGLSVSGLTTYTTTSSQNLASGSVSASGSSFSVSLPGSSITTIVSGGGTPSTPDPTTPPQQTVEPTSPPVPTTVPGSGNGLLGEYFSGTDLTNLVLTRIDPSLDMDWVQGSPDSSISSDNFSIRWTGKIEARSNETYTIITRSDDGMRVWIDNQQIINDWTEHAASADTEVSGTVSMQTGRQYDIRVEYFEGSGEASVQLYWSAHSVTRQIIPQSQLYSESVPQGNLGDVNDDGVINIVDALLTAQYYVGLAPSSFDAGRADVDCNGTVNIVDALLIAQYYVGLVDSFC